MSSRTVFLQQFQDAAHDDGGQPGPDEELLVIVDLVLEGVFDPQDGEGAAVHDKVNPLVDELDVVERRLREERHERKHPDQQDEDI